MTKTEAQTLKSEIEKTDKEIDQMTYDLYGLSRRRLGLLKIIN